MVQDRISCALCGAQDERRLFQPARSPGPVVQCRRCGLVYVSPRARSEALIYDGPELADQPTGLLHSRDLTDIEDSWEIPLLREKEAEAPALGRNAEAALDRLARHTPPAARLLDFGCGAGFFLGAARQRGWEIYGLEPLPGHAVYARARFGAEVVADTLRPRSFPPGHFDAITAFQVFEHLPDPSGTLTKLAGLLKPRGIVLVEVPNVATWSVRWLGPRHRHFVQDHIYFFSARTLSGLMEKCGFEVVDVYYPGRHMSVRHLMSSWGAQVLPGSLARLSAGAAKRAGLWERIVSLNLGDIVAVMGRKN
jgi:2-polyprenyl-3-methyl-5-hydroxy-6-metoxy-1,4-benzoquinol methylase